MTTDNEDLNEDVIEEIHDDTADIEVEVVDDTPEGDRGRVPLDETTRKALDEDDAVEKYSAKVEKRLAQLKRATHDERRSREAAERERDEAVKIAQMAYAERQQLRAKLQDGELWALDQSKRRAAIEIEQAKKKYQDAYDAGDSGKLVEAQQALNFATLEFDRIHHYTPQHTVQAQESMVQAEPQPERPKPSPKPDDRAVEWADENEWFGKDQGKTYFALGVHEELVAEGVDPKSEKYYEKLDSRLNQKFGTKRQQPATVVAPIGRSSKGTKVTLTTTQVSLARKLGVTNEHYARELLKIQGEI